MTHNPASSGGFWKLSKMNKMAGPDEAVEGACRAAYSESFVAPRVLMMFRRPLVR